MFVPSYKVDHTIPGTTWSKQNLYFKKSSVLSEEKVCFMQQTLKTILLYWSHLDFTSGFHFFFFFCYSDLLLTPKSAQHSAFPEKNARASILLYWDSSGSLIYFTYHLSPLANSSCLKKRIYKNNKTKMVIDHFLEYFPCSCQSATQGFLDSEVIAFGSYQNINTLSFGCLHPTA